MLRGPRPEQLVLIIVCWKTPSKSAVRSPSTRRNCRMSCCCTTISMSRADELSGDIRWSGFKTWLTMPASSGIRITLRMLAASAKETGSSSSLFVEARATCSRLKIFDEWMERSSPLPLPIFRVSRSAGHPERRQRAKRPLYRSSVKGLLPMRLSHFR